MERLAEWMDKELEGCRHLFVVSRIQVVYVNSTLVEAAFGYLPGQQDLEDDFKDQWLSRTHKEERLRLIHRLLRFSEKTGCRTTIVSRRARRGARLRTVGAGGLRQRGGERHQPAYFLSDGAPPPPRTHRLRNGEGDGRQRGGRRPGHHRPDDEVSLPYSAFRCSAIGSVWSWTRRAAVWAKWYVEGEEDPYTKVVHPIRE